MRLYAVLLALSLLAACGGSPLSLLTGGGPNVAANVQGGKTNTQTVGTTEVRETRQVVKKAQTVTQIADETQVKTETVETVIVRNDTPVWVILLLVIGWLLPSPGQIGDWLSRKIFRIQGVK